MTIPISKKLWRTFMRVSPKLALAFNLGKVFTRTLLKPESESTPVQFSFGPGIPMKIDLGEFASNDLYCLDLQFESTTLKLWRKISKESKVILDLGAHMGMFSLLSAHENAEAKVFSIEICKRNLEYLNENASRYPGITVVPKAIAPKRGSFLFQEDAISGGGFLIPNPEDENSRVRVQTQKSYNVEAIPLKEMMQELSIDSIDLVKMDLEGLEYELLLGQDEFWASTPPKNLIVEIGFDKKSPSRLNDILEAMKKRGYKATRIQGLYAFPWKEPEDLANWWFQLNSQ